jgi:hypothetical protein
MSQKPQSEKYARIILKSASLHRILKNQKKRYKAEQQEEQQQEYLVIPYVLTCAAYLEAKLNDSLHQHSIDRYGEDVANAMLSLGLPKKLNVLVPLMTDGQYRINKDHIVYQRLASLIQVRNSITHAKPELEEIEAANEELVPVSILFPEGPKFPRQFFTESDINLGASKRFSPLEYHDALDKLERWFFHRCPDKLRKVAMVVDRSKEPHWKAHHVTYAKRLSE